MDFWLNFFKIISFFGNTKSMIVFATLACILILFWRKEKVLASFIFLNYSITMLIVSMLKYFIAKPRNPLALVKETTFAFPSGHTAAAMTTFLVLAFVSKFIKNKFWKNFVRIFAIFWIFATISARLYLRVHDVYDIIASIIISCYVFYLLSQLKFFKRRYKKISF